MRAAREGSLIVNRPVYGLEVHSIIENIPYIVALTVNVHIVDYKQFLGYAGRLEELQQRRRGSSPRSDFRLRSVPPKRRATGNSPSADLKRRFMPARECVDELIAHRLTGAKPNQDGGRSLIRVINGIRSSAGSAFRRGWAGLIAPPAAFCYDKISGLTAEKADEPVPRFALKAGGR